MTAAGPRKTDCFTTAFTTSVVPMVPPATSYLLCANQRSGSTLLCRALSDTGVAGHPMEYFLTGGPNDFPDGWTFWEEGPLAQEHGVRDREEFLQVVYDVGSTGNGVFGAKLMWNNVPWVLAKFHEMKTYSGMTRAEVLHAAFPDLHVVHLTRRDRVRQAISWARAAQDGVWVVSDEEPARPAGDPSYVAEFIAGLEGLIVDGEQGWRDLYGELGLVPYEVVYEDLLTDDGYENALRGILRHLGVDDADVRVPPRRTHRQTDTINEQWVERYLQDRADSIAD